MGLESPRAYQDLTAGSGEPTNAIDSTRAEVVPRRGPRETEHGTRGNQTPMVRNPRVDQTLVTPTDKRGDRAEAITNAGGQEPDGEVWYGVNHPLSGSRILLESAQTLGPLMEAGWELAHVFTQLDMATTWREAPKEGPTPTNRGVLTKKRLGAKKTAPRPGIEQNKGRTSVVNLVSPTKETQPRTKVGQGRSNESIQNVSQKREEDYSSESSAEGTDESDEEDDDWEGWENKGGK